MSEVATEAVVESQDEAPEAEAATPAADEIATWKKRLAGKDQALTESQKKAAAAQAEAETLRRKVLEYEQANLSEAEKLTQRLAQLEKEASDARAEAAKARLARQFPLASDLLGDDIPLDEVRLADIEGRLKAAIQTAAGADEESEPRVDTNRPPRNTSAKRGPRTLDDIKSEMADAFKREFPTYGDDR